jgi:hypothetical protein
MKLLGVVSTAALLLLIGTAVPAFAQEDHHDQAAKPEKQDQQAKPAEHEQKAQPANQEEHAKPVQHEEQAKPVKQESQAKPAAQQEQAKSQEQHQQAKPVKQENQAEPVRHEQQARVEKSAPQNKPVKAETSRNTAEQPRVQHTAAQEQRQRAVPALRLSARGGGRIPDDRFRSNFGSGHRFRIGSPVMVSGYSRFQYGGFWFGFVQPWPVAWYYTDDVYVDYIDGGYYLCNPSYPGDRISISVVI